MKVVQISAVKRIRTADHNLVVLDLANGKPSIVRSPEQFLNDLRGSFLIDDNVVNMNHPQVRKALRNLRGGVAEGNIKHVKAGDTWTVTENSEVVKNPNAKGYGQYVAGDTKEYEKDATIVEDGFLTLDFKEDAYQREENAQAYAKERVSSASMLDIAPDFDGGASVDPTASASGDDEEGNDEDEGSGDTPISKTVATEATGE